jgi:hypothetical protein
MQKPGGLMPDPLPNRPKFKLPFPKGSKITIQTYVGHNPDDKKMDMYRAGMKTGSDIVAAAAGLVHQSFFPGGIEIDHGNGWFTTYMHMAKRIAVGTRVAQGDWVGNMGDIGAEGRPHLHHEQLFAGSGASNADNENIVNPIIQGKGPFILDPTKPIVMTSTNDEKTTGRAGVPVQPTRFWVDTFADAPVFISPTDTRQVGTLYRGTNYVFSKTRGREIRFGANFNHFWLKTDPDVGSGQWVSAYYLTRWGNDEAKDNNGKVIPNGT